ncbi:protein ATP6V1FNB-like [Monomorium pharaonis]|uniref:protein ATP6V1FNB-like n=1 Tax=Monomorium pharaonis TaxID=307658 RepID=UPI00063F9F0A|nr:protein ATP6V1FNB-like [Monomorium pharaonis]
MAKIGDVCDTRCQLFCNDRIRKENTIRIKWFLKNQKRLIDQLKEPKFTKRAREIIEESKKREAARVDRPIIQRKPLPLWRPPKSDDSINMNIMKLIEPNVKAILYEKGIPTFITIHNYLTERYKKPPEERFYFPECTNWIYGWRLDDYPPVPLSKVGLKSVMLAQFYQGKAFNLEQDPKWFRGCQKKNARNFDESLIY